MLRPMILRRFQKGFMFPSSNSKDDCFSGKKCIGATPAGNDNRTGGNGEPTNVLIRCGI